MHPFLAETVARDHHRSLLEEAARHRLLHTTLGRHPLRKVAAKRGRAAAPLLRRKWHRALHPQRQRCPCAP